MDAHTGAWILYGANGYTGALVAAAAVARGARPILAGRSEDKVRPLAERLGLPWRTFPVEDAAAVDRSIGGARLVLSCAGPFSQTSRPLVDGCLRQRAHYLDITGELSVFEENLARDPEARSAGVVLMSGVGFDVVPTDCLALALREALPGAVRLLLAFDGFSRVSAGTTKTAVEGLPQGGAIRKGGRLVKVPPAHEVRDIPFADGSRTCMAIPWGDVSTAYRTTGIPDITVFMAAPSAFIRVAKLAHYVAPVLARQRVQDFLKGQAERFAHGPTEAQRRAMRMRLWGRVEDSRGRGIEGTAEVPETYALTADAALACVERTLARQGPGGSFTPAGLFGSGLLLSLPGCAMKVPRD